MAGATRSIVFDAPIEKAFDVIVDYERYADFLPEVKSVRVSNRNGSTCDVHWEVDVIKTIRYTVRMNEARPSKVSWSFVTGEVMKDNKGGWVLESLGPDKTKATYTVEMALGPLVPKMIINKLVETSLPQMLENFKRRLETRK